MPKKNFGNVKEISINDLNFKIWCDGRSYDPVSETYRAIYSYTISTKDWRYDSNDIQGTPNEPPNINLGSIALLGMFLACVEAADESENAQLFPPHVREAGQYREQQLRAFCSEFTGE